MRGYGYPESFTPLEILFIDLINTYVGFNSGVNRATLSYSSIQFIQDNLEIPFSLMGWLIKICNNLTVDEVDLLKSFGYKPLHGVSGKIRS